MGRIAQDICLRWRGPNPFGPIRPPDLRPKGGEVRLLYANSCANYWQRFGVMQTVRDKATGVQLAWIEDGKVFDAKTRAMVALFATGKSSGSMECLSATSRAYAKPERRPMRSRGSLKRRRTNSRRLETLRNRSGA